ncbi:MAG: type IV secretory system conjugative DNA transfer family protein [Lachnospiraceae bacterium]|nr:type IV secretory system conjugative DNA transfer family protein [Lachnospiraceae bacterium]
MKKNKKKHKYNKWIGDNHYSAMNCNHLYYQTETNYLNQDLDNIAKQMQLNTCASPGFYFGYKTAYGLGQYVGLKQGEEGNILIAGANGSGKSSGIAKPTLYTWQGSICVTDIKGELSKFYMNLYQQGLVKRPYIIFDPTQMDSKGYDPFYLLKHDEDNLVSNICEIVDAIIPIPHDIKEPFWLETEQSIFKATLLYGFQLGFSFYDSINKIILSPINDLLKDISELGGELANMYIRNTHRLKPETLADIDRGLRNKLIVFSTDPYISNTFRVDADYFTWDDLDEANIFLRIPADKIDQWGGVINLMYTQLIRHLERRPEKYSPDGKNNVQTLLLMDEFARFGKLNIITDAVSTLRSKNVNICLFIQSLAQLDKLYGECDRRIILDNCQYKTILQANDADTQEYFSRLIGTQINIQRSKSENLDDCMDTIGYSKQSTEIRERIVFPHELSTLNDILLLSPYGFCRIDKIQLHNTINHLLFHDSKIFPATATIITPSSNQEQFSQDSGTTTTDAKIPIIHAKAVIIENK